MKNIKGAEKKRKKRKKRPVARGRETREGESSACPRGPPFFFFLPFSDRVRFFGKIRIRIFES